MNSLTISLTEEIFKKSKNYWNSAECPIAISVNSLLKKGFVAIVGGYDIAVYKRRDDDQLTLDKFAECIKIPLELIDAAIYRREIQ